MQRTRDLVSGEELVIAYFPKTGKITINGHSVIQSPKLTGRLGETVYHQVLGGKKFTVVTAAVAELYL